MRGHDIVMDLPVIWVSAVMVARSSWKRRTIFAIPSPSRCHRPEPWRVVKSGRTGVQRSNQPGDLIGRVQIMVPAKPGLAVKHAAKEFDEKAGDYLSL